MRATGALLALEITWVHVVDQGDYFYLRNPPYVGWGYRVVEAAGILVAAWLLSRWQGAWSWLVAAGLAAGPLIGYLLSRTTGLPDYPYDQGNWFEPLGITAVTAEAVLLVLAIRTFLRLRR